MAAPVITVSDSDLLLQTLPWGVLLLSPAGLVVLLNPAAEALWGLPAAAVLGQAPATVLPAVLPPALLRTLAPRAVAVPAASGEYWLPHTRQWVAQHTAPAADGRWWVYWDNITARHQAEEATRQHLRAERRTSQIINSLEEVAGTGYYEADLATMRFHFSDGMFRLFGEAPQAFEPTLDFIDARSHPEDVALVRQVLDQAIADKEPYHYQRRIYRPDGEERTVEAHGNVICDAAGVPVQLRGLVQDVTARVRAEAETRRLQASLTQHATDLYRTLFDSIDEGFALLDMQFDATGTATDGQILEVNQVFERQTGLADAPGKTLLEILPDMDPDRIVQYGHVAQTGQAVRFETFSQPLKAWYSVYAARVGGAGSSRVALVFDDITERKQHETALLQRNRRKAFLLKLSDALRPLATPGEIQRAACQIIGEHFELDRTSYIEIEPDRQVLVVKEEYVSTTAQHLAGTAALPPAAKMIAEMQQGRLLLIEDVTASPLVPPAELPAYAALAIRAFTSLPLMKEGRLVACLALAHSSPRQWRLPEIELLQEVAERTWAALEHAHAEEALHASEARLRAMLENLPGGAAFIVGPDLRYQLAAGTALHAVGYTANDFVGRTLAEVLPPDELAAHEARYRQALAGRSFMSEHETHGRAFLSRGTPLRSASGEVIGVLVISYDITDRRHAEEALRLSEGRLRIALEAAELGTWDWNLETNKIHWNERHFTLFGLPPGPNPQTPADFERHVHPDDRPAVMQWLQTAIAEQIVFRAEFRAITAQGAERWMSGYGQVNDVRPDGRPWRMSGVMLDITERKQAEEQLLGLAASLERKVARRTQALQLSRDLLQSVYDTTLIGMAVVRAERDAAGAIEDFTFVSVNRKLEQETGRPDLVGKRYTQEFPGIVPAGLLEHMRQAVATGTPRQVEYFYPYEEVNRWFSSMYVKLDGEGVVVTTLDITERKQAEAERDRQFALLQQAEAMAHLGSWEYELATGAFHWSAGMYRLFDLPAGSPVQPLIYLEYAEADDRPVAERLVRCLTQEPRDFEETLRLRIGTEVKTVRVRARVLRDPTGQPQRLLGVDLDLSEVRRLEADNLRLRLEQQRALFEAVQQAQEIERKRVAEALHNGVGQLLYATKLRLDQLLAPALFAAPKLLAARREADHLLADAIRQTRALSHELVPMFLEEFGLPAALKDVCQKLSSPQLRLHCVVQLDEALPPSMQLALYRMAQELAQNIVKHARGATDASLELETLPGFVVLRAEDNGAGFSPEATTGAGLGLRSVRDRVALLGGIMELGNTMPTGAYVRLRIPLHPG